MAVIVSYLVGTKTDIPTGTGKKDGKTCIDLEEKSRQSTLVWDQKIGYRELAFDAEDGQHHWFLGRKISSQFRPNIVLYVGNQTHLSLG